MVNTLRGTQDISWICYFIVLTLKIDVNKNYLISLWLLKLFQQHYSRYIFLKKLIRKPRFLLGEYTLISTMTLLCSKSTFVFQIELAKYFWFCIYIHLLLLKYENSCDSVFQYFDLAKIRCNTMIQGNYRPLFAVLFFKKVLK